MTDESTTPAKRHPFDTLAGNAESVAGFGILVMIAGVIGAAGLAIYTDDTETRPYVVEAIVLGVNALVTGAALRLLGVWASAWLSHARGDE